MNRDVRVAAVQLNTQLDFEKNRDRALELIAQAAVAGAELIVLPELVTGYGDLARVVDFAETIPGPTSQAIGALAVQYGVSILGGSIPEISPIAGRPYNTAIYFPRGDSQARVYRKMHLFEIDLPGSANACEAKFMTAGDEPFCFVEEFGTIGAAICYDLRFPELFRCLIDRGAEIILLPSAFTAATGRDHWEVLARARAIENQCYVVAANQCGRHDAQRSSYGHSLIIDPWGRILASAENEETILYATLSAHRLGEIRKQLPALKNRRIR